jgi:putative sterol carrier protein
MGKPTEHFFAELSKRGHVPGLEPFNGSVLFELEHGEHTERYFLTITKGVMSVARDGANPDCILRTDASSFDAIAAGELNAMQAVLRGLVDIEGQGILLAALQRLFPRGTAASTEPAGYARRQS